MQVRINSHGRSPRSTHQHDVYVGWATIRYGRGHDLYCVDGHGPATDYAKFASIVCEAIAQEMGSVTYSPQDSVVRIDNYWYETGSPPENYRRLDVEFTLYAKPPQLINFDAPLDFKISAEGDFEMVRWGDEKLAEVADVLTLERKKARWYEK